MTDYYDQLMDQVDNPEQELNAHKEDEVGQIIATIMNMDIGKKFMEVLYNDLVSNPRMERILSSDPRVSEGKLAYDMGKSDAYYKIKLCGESYIERAKQLGEPINE